MTGFLKKLWGLKLVRFLVVGCFNTTFDVSLLLVIIKLTNWPAPLANSLSVTISVSVSYFLNHRIVFRQKEGYSLKKYLHFFLVTGIGVLILQDTVLYLVIDRFWVINESRRVLIGGHNFHVKTLELLGAKLSAVLCGLAWNYLLYKYVVFRSHTSEDAKKDQIVIS